MPRNAYIAKQAVLLARLFSIHLITFGGAKSKRTLKTSDFV